MQKGINPVRILFVILALISFLSPKAQTYLPAFNMNGIQWTPFPDYNQIRDSRRVNQKWYLNTYTGLSAGFGFFNGGSATVISAPVGVQLNRPLNNNLVAFAGVSAGPSFFSFSRSFTDPAFNKSYPGSNFSNAYGLGIHSRMELGLMYINDAKTFSISGSIGVERSSFPLYPVEPKNTKRQ
ncbi:MAG TPA: hypothetical protein VK543_08000 [Puia sp.]|nr:hypothetical protein [Puia sp.]